MLCVIDDFTRECLALVADTSLSGARVVRELERCIRLYGRPETIVSDTGTELTSRVIREWQNHTTARPVRWRGDAARRARRLVCAAVRVRTGRRWSA